MGKILKPINLDENLEDFKKTIEKLPLEAGKFKIFIKLIFNQI